MGYPWVRICLLLFKWEKQTREAENSHLKKKRWDILKKGILKGSVEVFERKGKSGGLAQSDGHTGNMGTEAQITVDNFRVCNYWED